ncbi:hypothetical protein D3C80_2102150 [compost metagenome]
MFDGAEALTPSVTTTLTVSPLASGGVRVTVKLPSGFTVALVTVPPGPVMVTLLAPGAWPVMAVPSALKVTSTSVGGV